MGPTRRAKIALRVGNRNVARVLWEEIHGPIAPGLEICHECHTPACINLRHLHLGTHAENVAESIGVRRVRPYKVYGPELLRAKSLRATGKSIREIATMFNVAESTMSKALRRG